MRAMVLAAGLGTRLRPLTNEITKPMVPVLDRPVMAHILDLLDRHGFERVIANLHYFPDSIKQYFGERLSYRYEEELLGTAGGVRACADFFGDEAFLIISGDALTDIDLGAFVARHREAGGSARSRSRRWQTRASTEWSCTTATDVSPAFRRSPVPRRRSRISATAASTSSSPPSSTTSRSAPSWTGPKTYSRPCLEHDVPFHIHEVRDYWNDVGSLSELRQGTFDALNGELRLQVEGREVARGVTVAEGSVLPDSVQIDGAVWIGRDVQLGENVRLTGPIVLGDGVRVGDGAQLRESIVLPGTEVADEAILIGAIAGHAGILDSLRPR